MDEEAQFQQFAEGANADVAANIAGELRARKEGMEAAKEAAKKANPMLAAAKEAGAKLMAAMKRQKATWQMDGKGIRGDVVKVSNSRANLIWDSTVATRRADSNIEGGDTIAHADADPAAADPGG